MTYSIGTAHVLTGTGQVSIAAPIGLKVALTNVPANAGRLAGHLPEYYGLGRLAVGNADGFLPALYLKHASGLFYPLPDSLSLLEYTVSAGVTATVTELLAGAVPNFQKQPQDRNPTPVLQVAGPTNLAAGTADTVAWTFTVPANRILRVEYLDASLLRVSAASVVNYTFGYVTVASSIVLYVDDRANALGYVGRDQVQGPLDIPAGTVLSAHYAGGDTGGLHIVHIAMRGFTYDV